MIRFLIEHAHRHAVAYVALGMSVLALGGAAYAQINIPPGSVGERQIKNHVIDPVKWDRTYVTGFIRRWATVSAQGSLLSTAPNGQSVAVSPGYYEVTWGDAFAGWCAPVATVTSGSTPPPYSAPGGTGTQTTTPSGYADASIVPRNGLSTVVAVGTYNALGQPTPEPFSVTVACGPGAGGGQTFPTNLP